MSGIEVAGIALAVFPIILNGISHFVEGIETIKRWQRYRVRLLSYADVIEAQKVYYLDTLEGLLIDIVDSEDEMARLMAEPGGVSWQKTVYAQRLKDRLDRSYFVFLRVTKDILQNLSGMCRKLGVGRGGEILWDEYSVVERGMNRLKVTLSKNVYQGYIDAIDKANKDLRDITRQNVYLEPLRRSRKKRQPSADIKLIRRHAASLYQLLIAGAAWSCQCRKYHLASLRLEPRSTTTVNDRSSSDSRYNFRVMLSRSQQALSVETNADWQEIEIKPSTVEYLDPSPHHEAPRQSKKVRFVTRSGNNTESRTISPDRSPPIQSTIAIVDMCQTLYSHPKCDEPMGFLRYDHDKDYKHYLYRANIPPMERSQSKSLSDLLSETTVLSPSGGLLKRERLEIAVTLASSVLQLDGSSWLKSRWSSHDIYFHQKRAQKPSQNSPQPYLGWKQCSIKDDLVTFTESLSLESHLIRSEVLFALGRTLVELCFGKTLKSMRLSDDSEESEEIAAAKTALNLIDQVYDEMGDVYGDVVRRCLLQPFDVRDMSLDNEEVQWKVYESIVAPLAEDLENFKGKARIR
ncbi:MAG: hypothetical protein Q9195_006566 [Heterodermia aff. obscurata]